MQIDLSGHLALVTGATGDLGRVMVRVLADCGANVAVHYRQNRAKADELCRLVESSGGEALAVQAEVGDIASVTAMKDCVAANLGSPDIIVNNAVTQYPWKSVLEQPVEDYVSQFETCVLHNVNMVKTFLPGMVERGWGRVIGINTECSLQCWPGQSAYVSGKHGMTGFLQTLAKEVGPMGVTVNQVAPGWMYSDRDREKSLPPDAQPNAYAQAVPLKHRGEDVDVAWLVAFLASGYARFITGAFIPVNGGGPVLPVWAD